MATTAAEKETGTGQNEDNANVKASEDGSEKATEAKKSEGGYFVSKLV